MHRRFWNPLLPGSLPSIHTERICRLHKFLQSLACAPRRRGWRSHTEPSRQGLGPPEGFCLQAGDTDPAEQPLAPEDTECGPRPHQVGRDRVVPVREHAGCNSAAAYRVCDDVCDSEKTIPN